MSALYHYNFLVAALGITYINNISQSISGIILPVKVKYRKLTDVFILFHPYLKYNCTKIFPLHLLAISDSVVIYTLTIKYNLENSR